MDSQSINTATLLSAWDLVEEAHLLTHEPWGQAQNSTRVMFKAMHDTSSFLVIFEVSEKHTLATCSRDNDPVYQDSCVEIFLKHHENEYCNFEFNAIGTCLAQTGPDRSQRIFLNQDFLNNVSRQSSLGSDIIPQAIPFDSWKLAVRIPLSTLTGQSLSGLKMSGNFYKCGDNLPTPHYLCWSSISTPKPDFHRPEFFTSLYFE